MATPLTVLADDEPRRGSEQDEPEKKFLTLFLAFLIPIVANFR